MRWFEFTDTGGILDRAGQLEHVFLADPWVPRFASLSTGVLGACRGVLFINDRCMLSIRSTWSQTDIIPLLDTSEENYRTGEVFGWEAIVSERPKVVSRDALLQQHFTSSILLSDYAEVFPNKPAASSIAVEYRAGLFQDSSEFPEFSVSLLGTDGVPVMLLAGQPEGRLACKEPGLR